MPEQQQQQQQQQHQPPTDSEIQIEREMQELRQRQLDIERRRHELRSRQQQQQHSSVKGNLAHAYSLSSGIATGRVGGREPQDGDAAASDSLRTHDDAVEFLDRVREMFSDLPFIYNSFLAVMKEFKDQTITTDGVTNRVKVLFKGHPDLIQGFNLFLSPAYRIRVEAESPPTTAHEKIEDQKAQQFAIAYKYVTKVKKCFADAPHTYKEFLAVLHRYQTVHRSVELVNTEITRLFRSHPDLLSEFAVFLPERSQPSCHHPTSAPPPPRLRQMRRANGGHRRKKCV